jgi:hypothetical protein
MKMADEFVISKLNDPKKKKGHRLFWSDDFKGWRMSLDKATLFPSEIEATLYKNANSMVLDGHYSGVYPIEEFIVVSDK